MKDVLVATDLSPSSEHALARAIGLAAQFEGRLAVLHVVDDRLPGDVTEGLRLRAEQIIRARLADEPAAAGREIGVEVVTGDPFAEILNHAWKRRSELIVMGVHRKAPFRDLFRGTTMERVLRRGDYPTLVVRERPAKPYRRVLVAIDFSIGSRRALEVALHLVPDGEFHILHAYDVPFPAFLTDPRTKQQVEAEHGRQLQKLVDEEMKAFLGQFAGLRQNYRVLLRQGMPLDAMEGALREVRPDVLALGTHGRTGIARAMLGSLAAEVLADPPCDVIAVKGW